MEIWNSKSSHSIYSDFKVKFGVLSNVIFRHTIYFFKAYKFRSPTHQTVSKSKLKQRSYGNMKTTALSCRTISKLFRNDPNFEFTHYHLDVLPPPLVLHLGHSIRPKWSHTIRNHIFIIFSHF